MRAIKYEVFPFLITDSDNFSVIQNCKNTVIIKDQAMRNFFRHMDECPDRKISSEDLETFYSENVETALAFMLKNQLIAELKEKKLEYNEIIFLSNDKLFLESIEFNSRGISARITCKTISMNLTENMFSGDKLYVLFLNPFDYNSLSALITRIRENNVIVKVAFYYNHRIYISNYYKYEWYNPCPVCFFGNIESTLMGRSKINKSISFQALVDLIYSKVPNFQIVNNFSHFDILILIESILSDVCRINDNRQINNVKVIDFNNNIITNDEAIHWEMCDCYE